MRAPKPGKAPHQAKYSLSRGLAASSTRLVKAAMGVTSKVRGCPEAYRKQQNGNKSQIPETPGSHWPAQAAARTHKNREKGNYEKLGEPGTLTLRRQRS